MPWIRKSISGSAPRIPFPRPTMPVSGISSPRNTKKNWKEKFTKAGIEYFFTLIDDAVARIMKIRGRHPLGVQELRWRRDVRHGCLGIRQPGHDDLCSGFAPGYFEYEAAHGTVQKHYYKHLKGEKTSTNSMAMIFAWSGALRKRGEIDGSPEVSAVRTCFLPAGQGQRTIRKRSAS